MSALRPLGFGDILDSGCTLYRRSFSTFFGISLLPQVPFIIFRVVALVGPDTGDALMEAASALLTP